MQSGNDSKEKNSSSKKEASCKVVGTMELPKQTRKPRKVQNFNNPTFILPDGKRLNGVNEVRTALTGKEGKNKNERRKSKKRRN